MGLSLGGKFHGAPVSTFPIVPCMERGAVMKRRLTCRDIALAALAGFFVSFAMFFFAVLFPSDLLFQAQLIVGTTEYPTTYNTFLLNQQFQAATVALGSFWFWTGVSITGFFLMLFFLRCMRM